MLPVIVKEGGYM